MRFVRWFAACVGLLALGCASLVSTAERGDTAAVREMLANGEDPNSTGDSGRTALHIAARESNLDMANALLERGASVDAQDSAGCTPLSYAAGAGSREIVELLLSRKANPNVDCIAGMTPLMRAASHGHAEVVEALLDAGANPWARSTTGMTLESAAEHGRSMKVVKVLLRRGAMQLSSKIPPGFNDLHAAAVQGDVAALKAMLVASDPDSEDGMGCSPLTYAVANGEDEAALLLLERGAKPDNFCTLNDVTPLMMASELGNLRLLDALLGRRANVNAKARDGYTALLYAARNGQREVVIKLLDAGADQNARAEDGTRFEDFLAPPPSTSTEGEALP